MKLIDKLVADGVIKEEEISETLINYCPSKFGYKNPTHTSENITLDKCWKCWSREVEE